MNYFKEFPFIKEDIHARSLSFFFQDKLMGVDRKMIDELRRVAVTEKKNARLCVHISPDDDLHNMIICQCKGTYIRPHKHATKSEGIHLIEGTLTSVVFNDAGNVLKKINMAPNTVFAVRTEKNYYHTYIPTSEYVIYHESKPGPFIRAGDSIIAPWSLDETSENVEPFINTLISQNG